VNNDGSKYSSRHSAVFMLEINNR